MTITLAVAEQNIIFTVQGLLYAALLVVTGWLGVAVRILWNRSQECEVDRNKMREDILTLSTRAATLEAQVKAMQACPAKECPMRRAA